MDFQRGGKLVWRGRRKKKEQQWKNVLAVRIQPADSLKRVK